MEMAEKPSIVEPGSPINTEFQSLIDRLRDRPVFICGHPKAGTSLLRAVLDSHPQLIVYPEETMFFRRALPQLMKRDLEEQIRIAERTVIHVFNWNRNQPHPSQAGFPDRDYSSLSFNKIRDWMEQLCRIHCHHPGDLLSAAVMAFGITAGMLNPELCYWVEKSPYNEYFAQNIFEWWPEARCIHILRDPRDNFVSYRRKHPDWNAEFFVSNWSRSTKAGIKNQEVYGKNRYWFVRFEDLTNSPDEHLARLADFLGINWNSSLAHPTRAGSHWGGNSMFEDQFQTISTAPVARWKDKLNKVDAEIIRLMSGSLLERWDYPGESDIQFKQRLVARLRSQSWPLRRPFYHSRKAAQASGNHPL